jgi:hypothetical protein
LFFPSVASSIFPLFSLHLCTKPIPFYNHLHDSANFHSHVSQPLSDRCSINICQQRKNFLIRSDICYVLRSTCNAY